MKKKHFTFFRFQIPKSMTPEEKKRFAARKRTSRCRALKKAVSAAAHLGTFDVAPYSQTMEWLLYIVQFHTNSQGQQVAYKIEVNGIGDLIQKVLLPGVYPLSVKAHTRAKYYDMYKDQQVNSVLGQTDRAQDNRMDVDGEHDSENETLMNEEHDESSMKEEPSP